MNIKKYDKKSWWNVKWGKDKFCGITQARLRPGKNKDGIHYCTFLECGHGFYTKALFTWIFKSQTNPTCPMCRKPIYKL